MVFLKDIPWIEDVIAVGSGRLPGTEAALVEGVASGVAPGFVAGYWRASRPDRFHLIAHGNRRIIPSAQPMLPGTVFDIASVSKVMGTATLASILVARGWMDWDTPVQAVLPEFRHPQILVRHLLSHTAGFEAWKPYWEILKNHFAPTLIEQIEIAERQREMRKQIFLADPVAQPGEKMVYSDICFLLMGFVLEEITQMPLDQAVRRFVWEPMRLSETFYARVDRSVEEGRLDRVAATEDCPWRGGVIQGQVHDDNCWSMGGYAGHAGVFSTVSDVLRFGANLIMGFLPSSVLIPAWTRVDQPPGCERTLGWDTPSGPNPSVGSLFSDWTVGHLGFTGASLWIDVREEWVVVLLSNRVHPSRENWKIREFRPRFHNALREDLRCAILE